MKRLLPLIYLLVLIGFSSCEREIEEDPVDLGFDFQPLEVGRFWIYSVDQTIYFGENDSETDSFYYKDLIFSSFLNEENEQVFILERSKSADQEIWEPVLNYTLQYKGQTLVRTIENQALVTLVFPPKEGTIWDANTYRDLPVDEFEVFLLNDSGAANSLQVKQEEADDLVTYRDIRYENYQLGVGLIEDYKEVLTYCSRNDCLGDQLIDSGSKIHMKLTEYGKQ